MIGPPSGALCEDIVGGAVRVSTTTEPHMAAKAAAPTASRAASGVKYSWKIHTLSAMLTIGLTMTSNGWETLSGPARSVDWWRTSAPSPAPASA